jgi:DNA-binding response OmpR family regulator
MARILIVDDEAHIVDVVRAYLVREGHSVSTATDGEAALEVARSVSPDLIVLDVMLPKRSGFDVLRDLRARDFRGALIMLTARDDVIDRVAALEIGADDYLTKPFEPRELVARVGAILRRTGARVGRIGDPPLRFFDLEIDLGAREVNRGGTPVALTRIEFDLFVALTDRPGRVLTRDQLASAMFGEAFGGYDRTIDSHVKNLRHKLGARPGGAQYIETARGVGYRSARP